MKEIEILDKTIEKYKKDIANYKEIDKNHNRKIVFIENENSEIINRIR